MSNPLVRSTVAPAPETALEEYKARWLDIGLAAKPAQRAEAETAVRRIYAAAGLDAPRKVVWTGSPFAQGLARGIVLDPEFLEQIVAATVKHAVNPAGTHLLPAIAETFRNSMRLFDTGAVKEKLFEAIRDSVRTVMVERMTSRMTPQVRASAAESVWNGVWQSVWFSVGDCVARGIEAGLRKMAPAGVPDRAVLRDALQQALQNCIGTCVKVQVWENPMDAAWGNVRNSISSQIRVLAWEGLWKTLQATIWQDIATPIGDYVKGCGNDSAQSSGYGQHDAYWLAFYAYFREAHGLVIETEPVEALLELASHAGWFAPHERICWMSERPSRLAVDQQGRLQANDGSALAYPDGWAPCANIALARAPASLQAV
jgi:hypothetical protein